MSGFAHVTGQPDGPPTLPPFMLADGVAAMSATYAVMTALYHRDMHDAGGQLVDISLVEPLARLVEQATLAYDQLGAIQPRTGNRVDASAPRNTYRTVDDKWVAVSSAASSTAIAVYRAIERPDLATRPDYVDPVPRQRRSEEIDRLVADWVAAHSFDQVMKVFLAEGVAAAPMYDAGQLLADEHFQARGTFVAVDDPDLGTATVQAPVAVLSETPGAVQHLGRGLGADNDSVYGGLLGLDAARMDALREAGAI
jgi:crotonobetainyl-CoA:carnitine CoA-transferase CaiB-like acyl-CoA transferase